MSMSDSSGSDRMSVREARISKEYIPLSKFVDSVARFDISYIQVYEGL